jgi:2-oxoglutarate ferredoxin oxidoreductase subunit alpha
VIAARTPADCFDAAIEASRVALEHMTPVILLSDAALANSSESWRAPDLAGRKPIMPPRVAGPSASDERFAPFARDEKFVRAWALPGTPGLEHCIGGLEKSDVSGGISYDGDNHQRMTECRAARIEAIEARLDDALDLYGEQSGGLLLLSWGGTFGAVRKSAVDARRAGLDVSHVHLRWLNPLPRSLDGIVRGFDRVLVPEMNSGQLTQQIRARYLVDAVPLSLMKGRPFRGDELRQEILRAMNS